MDPVWVPLFKRRYIMLTYCERENYFKQLTTADRISFHLIAEMQLGTKSVALVLQHVYYHLRLIDMKEHSHLIRNGSERPAKHEVTH